MAEEPKTVIEHEHQEHAATALLAAIKTGLADFGRHKDELLSDLRNEYDHRLKSVPVHGDRTEQPPFDNDKTWRHLESLVSHYLHREWLKQQVTKPSDRQAQLRDIAKVLERARDRISETMQSDVGNDLISGWWEGTTEYVEAEGRFVDLLYIQLEFEKVVTSLSALETAAHRAADDVRAKAGRPKGTAVLQKDDIEGLAAVYRDSTGSTPGAGYGPFAKFAIKFLTALGRSNIKYESVIDAIKDARRWALKRPAATKWGPSPFDEEFDEKE